MRDAARMPRELQARRLNATGAMLALDAGALGALWLPTTLPPWASVSLLLFAAIACILRTRVALTVLIVATLVYGWFFR